MTWEMVVIMITGFWIRLEGKYQTQYLNNSITWSKIPTIIYVQFCYPQPSFLIHKIRE